MQIIEQRMPEKAVAWERPEEISPFLYSLLLSRGIASREEAYRFLHPLEQSLSDPALFPNLMEAADRICDAIAAGKKLCVYGDYDVDGTCACAILSGALRSLGAEVRVYIPSREDEGYGMNDGAVRRLADEGIGLIVTVDCGISDRKRIELARELGVDVIVTDHHRVNEENLPDCLIVSAQLGECECPDLCGAGVAYKLACALDRENEERYIEFAAQATVADSVPLKGENRVIVARGLRKLNEHRSTPFEALLSIAGMGGREINEETLGFQTGPRLNAGGRLGSAMRSYSLLCARTQEEAAPYANELNDANTERRMMENTVLADAARQLEHYDFTGNRAIVLAGTGWNPGVIGIAASKLEEQYHYPVILFAEVGGELRGSCRSIDGIDIFRALCACDRFFVRYGGHAAAAGCTLLAENFAPFKEALNEYLRENADPKAYIPRHVYDLEVPVGEMRPQICRDLQLLHPCGTGNPAPVFRVDFTAETVRRIGSDLSHLKLRISDDGRYGDAIWFRHGTDADWILQGRRYTAIGALSLDVYMQTERAQLKIETVLETPDDRVRALLASGPSMSGMRSVLMPGVYAASEPINAESAAELLRTELQGVVAVCAAPESAETFRAEHGLIALDAVGGRWTEDARCYTCFSVCPEGTLPEGVRTVISLDADMNRYALSVAGSGARLFTLEPMVRTHCWLDELPDKDALRRVLLAARDVSRRPLYAPDRDSVVRAIAEAAGLPETTANAGCAALEHMRLLAFRESPNRPELLPFDKNDPAVRPENDAVFKLFEELGERRRQQ